MALLVDSGPLIALVDRNDVHHAEVVAFLEAADEQLIVPVTVLPEVCYMLQEHVGARAELAFVRSLASGELTVEQVSPADFSRIAELLQVYADNPIGFVDASIVAMAERLRITRLLTLDRRHFGSIRPRHAVAFELVP